jgi:lipopolysaccharide assembly protein A
MASSTTMEDDMHVKFILTLALIGLVVLFITQNVTPVDVTFLFWTISMSRALLIFFVLSIGIGIGWFLHSYYTYRREKKNLDV